MLGAGYGFEAEEGMQLQVWTIGIATDMISSISRPYPALPTIRGSWNETIERSFVVNSTVFPQNRNCL